MKDRAQPSLCRPERQAPGGLGWAEGGGDGRVWGDPAERGDLKEKQRGAWRETQGPDPAEGAAYPRPCDQPDTLGSLKTGRDKVS